MYGETDTDPATGAARTRFPSLATLAKRYGVAPSTIGKFSARQRCQERRDRVLARAGSQFEAQFIEKVVGGQAANAPMVDVVAVVNEYLAQFGQRLREGQIRTDSAADFERLARLRELVTGKADSRPELTGGISLEAIQSRHHALRVQTDQVDPALTGIATATADDEDDCDDLRAASREGHRALR